MGHSACELEDVALRVDVDRRLKLECHGRRITYDARLLAYRELDDALGLSDLAGAAPSECHNGRNTRRLLAALLRQSVFGRLAGYEDVNDADRLAHGRGCPARGSPPTRSGCNCAPCPTISATFFAPWRCPRRSSTGRRPRCAIACLRSGAKIVRHGRSIAFQMAEVMAPRALFQQILDAIAALWPEAPRRC